jgi:GDPmannose 4,6-dehydratase
MVKKRALITGVTGQDGSYLTEFLLTKGYRVFGLVRRSSSPNYERIEHISDKIELIQGDLLDQNSLIEAIQCVNPMKFIISVPKVLCQHRGINLC